MRYVIACTAFLVPLLIVVAIGASFATPTGPRARLDSAALGELRDFVQQREALLDRYVCQPGQVDAGSMPHLALERFDRRGCDRGGQPWYRLQLERAGLPCGVLRRAAEGPTPTLVDGGQATLVLPLSPVWAYWETAPPPPPPAAPPGGKSP